jgi:hypothetical protein
LDNKWPSSSNLCVEHGGTSLDVDFQAISEPKGNRKRGAKPTYIISCDTIYIEQNVATGIFQNKLCRGTGLPIGQDSWIGDQQTSIIQAMYMEHNYNDAIEMECYWHHEEMHTSRNWSVAGHHCLCKKLDWISTIRPFF